MSIQNDDDGPRSGHPRVIRATVTSESRRGNPPAPAQGKGAGQALAPPAVAPLMFRGKRLKFKEAWRVADGSAVPTTVFATGFDEGIQRWSGAKPIDTLRWASDEKPPSIDKLNAAVPQDLWEVKFGDLSPPYEHTRVICFKDIETGSEYTYSSSAKGAARAIGELRDQIIWKSSFCGGRDVVPLIKLDAVTYKTRDNTEGTRPDFRVVNWWYWDPSATAENRTLKRLPKVSFGTELGDEIPF